jgi:hypothetical protein
MPRRKDLPCGECGRLMVRYNRIRPDDEARCQPCRNTTKSKTGDANSARPRARCSGCGKRMDSRAQPGFISKCRGCRPRLTTGLTCADCGSSMSRGPGALPPGKARCRACRKARPVSTRQALQLTCQICGKSFERLKNQTCCSRQCLGKWRTVRADDDPHLMRSHREARAPGLTKAERTKLRNKWTRQQRQCHYCTAPGITIDHVLPLVRGGTHYEGNLVPACLSCNSSKSGKTIIEWRHGVSLGKVREAPEWSGKQITTQGNCASCGGVYMVRREGHLYCSDTCRAKASYPAPTPHPCPMCQTPTTRNVYCSAECSKERVRRYIRDKYRANNGLDVDPSRPTKPWLAQTA